MVYAYISACQLKKDEPSFMSQSPY